MNKIKKVLGLMFFLGVLFFSGTVVANASTLYFDPAKGQHGPGDIFTVDIKLDISQQCVNTVEATIIFPKDIIKVEDFSTGSSMISLWIDNPSGKSFDKINSEGVLHFSGGIPGGYCGKIPGDPGVSNVIAKIIFSVNSLAVNSDSQKQAKINFVPETSSILLNDGQGTADSLSIKSAEFTINGKQILVKDEWQEEVKNDNIQPEPFIIELQHDPAKAMFSGKYYVIFSAIDKQTGVDHYELLEIKPNAVLGEEPKLSFWEKLLGKKISAPTWKKADSPYLLEDQNLGSIIRVKAVDKAGNERIVEYIPPQQPVINKSGLEIKYIYLALIIILLLFILPFVWRRKK